VTFCYCWAIHNQSLVVRSTYLLFLETDWNAELVTVFIKFTRWTGTWATLRIESQFWSFDNIWVFAIFSGFAVNPWLKVSGSWL